MRVLCMVPTMSGPGGAERIMSYLVAHLAQRHDVTLLTLDRPDALSFYPVPDSVRRVGIDKLGRRGIRRLVRVLSRPLRIRRDVRALNPDIVVSFMDTMNVTALISCVGLGVPVIVSERNDPALNRIGRLKELLRDRIYPLARCVVMQTNRAARYFPPGIQPKLRVIPNPVPPSPLCAQPDQANAQGRWRVIAVGRLEQQKGFDLLIEAFGRIAHERLEWDLVIFGEGSERARLEASVERLDLDGRVWLPGIVTEMSAELAASHLMAFPSLYEGFPNALAEGLAVGLPAVGYRDVSGVEDLIIDGDTGLLVNSSEGVPSLASGLSALMKDARLRRRLGEAARKHVARWAPRDVLAEWESVLVEAAGPTRSD
jgi:GalNAc-alpha-(1->4)-GalNAc-alpha-(1->3)-diNAcBac-PP-undecaprenol alpha-1,4-N-acetyl-D-galactosaminyltransferase